MTLPKSKASASKDARACAFLVSSHFSLPPTRPATQRTAMLAWQSHWNQYQFDLHQTSLVQTAGEVCRTVIICS